MVTENRTLTANLDITELLVAVSGAPGGAGVAIASSAASSLVEINNTSPGYRIEYSLDGGTTWTIIDPGTSDPLPFDLSAGAIKLRKFDAVTVDLSAKVTITAQATQVNIPPGKAQNLGGGGGGLTTGRLGVTTGNLLLTDANTILYSNSASNQTFTIPQESSVAWAADTVIGLYQGGAGVNAFAAGAGVTLRSPSGIAASVQYGHIFARRVGVNEWALL